MGEVRAALLLMAGLLACSGEEAAKPDPAPPVTVPLTLPTTAEQILTDGPEPPSGEGTPTTAPASTTTTLATGLPVGLGVPGAGNVSLGSGSSISNGFTVREVAFLEVVAFVLTELAADGWAVQAVPGGDDGVVVLRFAGPGAVGQAAIEPVPDGTVHVQVVLQGG
jgi:hypothetical protein